MILLVTIIILALSIILFTFFRSTSNRICIYQNLYFINPYNHDKCSILPSPTYSCDYLLERLEWNFCWNFEKFMVNILPCLQFNVCKSIYILIFRSIFAFSFYKILFMNFKISSNEECSSYSIANQNEFLPIFSIF